jgi:hypothetical protein
MAMVVPAASLRRRSSASPFGNHPSKMADFSHSHGFHQDIDI